MGGWKTWTGAISLILAGGSLVAAGMASDPIDFAKVAEGAAMVAAGLAALGLGFKIEKAAR